jgi:shikimate kinase
MEDGSSDEAGWTVVPTKQAKRQQKQGPAHNSLAWIDALPIYPPPPIGEPPIPPSLLLLVGLPGSGKSTLADALCRCRPDRYVRINQDTLGSRTACVVAVQKALFDEGKCPIIDRCNMSIAQRRVFLNLLQRPAALLPSGGVVANDDSGARTSSTTTIHADCVVLAIPAATCIDRCRHRRHHPTVPPSKAHQIVTCQQQEYQEPSSSQEGFRTITIIRDEESFRRVLGDILLSR